MKTLIIIPLVLLYFLLPAQQKNKKGQIKLANVVVVDTPIIEWTSYPSDTTLVGSNIQTFTCLVKSRIPFQRLEVRINGINMDVYGPQDFSPAKEANKYEQIIERSITLRTGLNSIIIVAENDKGIRNESQRRVLVDPNQISILRDKKDQTPPMVYVSSPTNIRDDHVLVYEDVIRITGTAIDESGIQELLINKIKTPVRENGAFSIYLPLNVGDNPIAMEVKDVNQNISLKKFTIERKNTDGSVYDPAEAKNYLLIIGIDKYQSWPALNNAVADAKAVEDVLLAKYRFDSANVITLLNEEANRSNINLALRSLIEKVSVHDNLLIYYSGHGYFDKLLSEGYWVPIDAAQNDISSYLPNSQILKIIENINSQHTFLVADACFSGSLFATGTRGYTDHVEKYKSRWGLASGRLEFVSDGSAGTNSPFAQSFIEFLRNNTEPKFSVSDLVQYVKKKVSEVTDQTPVGNPLKGVGDEGGEFIFYKRTE